MVRVHSGLPFKSGSGRSSGAAQPLRFLPVISYLCLPFRVHQLMTRSDDVRVLSSDKPCVVKHVFKIP
jgi:hypothetical protein